jgi:hypothetical protein
VEERRGRIHFYSSLAPDVAHIVDSIYIISHITRITPHTRAFFNVLNSGMDPISRRHVWDVISDAKQGRAVVLTTHRCGGDAVDASNMCMVLQ